MKQLLKKLYELIPFKKQLFLLLKKFNLPHSIYQHLHFKDEIRVRCEDTHFQMMHYGFEIENEIFWKGLDNSFEKVSIRLWMQLVKKASVILDVGANTGIYTLIAKSLHKEATIHTFEPLYFVFEKLKRNIQLNDFDAHLHQIALSNYTGKAKVYTESLENVYSVTVNKNTIGNRSKNEIEIDTITLDEFIKRESISSIDLIKLDVETHEPEVLEGFKQHLTSMKPDFLIEILNDEVAEKIATYFDNTDYLFFNIDDINNTIQKSDKITKSNYFNYLICKPETAQYLKLI